MGSIGTALEKICAIKILVNPTDSDTWGLKVNYYIDDFSSIKFKLLLMMLLVLTTLTAFFLNILLIIYSLRFMM